MNIKRLQIEYTNSFLKKSCRNQGHGFCFCFGREGFAPVVFVEKIPTFANTNFAMQCHTNTLKIRSTSGSRI